MSSLTYSSLVAPSGRQTENLFRKGVNNSRKVSTRPGKRLSTTSEKRAKTVNQNQEKTKICFFVSLLHCYINRVPINQAQGRDYRKAVLEAKIEWNVRILFLL